MIEVRQTGTGEPLEFRVTVRDDGGESRHRVTMSEATFEKLGGGKRNAEDCVRAAFGFLLDRESKEAILERFDVSVISRYFPEFEREIGRYLE